MSTIRPCTHLTWHSLIWLVEFLILYAIDRYDEAREEEKLRSQREDFSDMVAEVCLLLTRWKLLSSFRLMVLICKLSGEKFIHGTIVEIDILELQYAD